MFDAGYQAYQSTSVEGRAAGADIHKLVLMLFDGFLEELERVVGHIGARRFDKKAEGVDKLLRILGGLDASLDQENGGDVALNMKRLYDFCGQALVKASMQNITQPIDDVRAIMTNLQQGWQGLGSQAA